MEFVESLGADLVLPPTDGWLKAVQEATDGQAVDQVVDPIGGDAFDDGHSVTPVGAVSRDRHAAVMSEPFIGSAALAAGAVNRHALRTRFAGVPTTGTSRGTPKSPPWCGPKRPGCGRVVTACWRASRPRPCTAGRWIDPGRPATVIPANGRRARGLEVWADRLKDDEIECGCSVVRITAADTEATVVRRLRVAWDRLA